MMVGFLAVMVGTGVGAMVGLVSGYFMGKLDAIVQRIVDMWMIPVEASMHQFSSVKVPPRLFGITSTSNM